jgi:putative phosphoribosyl transferase
MTAVNAFHSTPLQFRDRPSAGRFLAELLRELDGSSPLLVFGIPRGGLPVAREIARALSAPVDALVIQKIALPAHSAWDEPPVAGAVAPQGVKLVDTRKLGGRRIPAADLEEAIAAAARERARREQRYRGEAPYPDVRDATVIVVDDGIGTGVTMRAAVAAIRTLRPRRLIVAVPAGTAAACQELEALVDALVCPVRVPALDCRNGPCFESDLLVGAR